MTEFESWQNVLVGVGAVAALARLRYERLLVDRIPFLEHHILADGLSHPGLSHSKMIAHQSTSFPRRPPLPINAPHNLINEYQALPRFMTLEPTSP